MTALKLILGVSFLASQSSLAYAQYNKVVEPVPTAQHQVVRGQVIRQGDVSPAQHAALLEEARKIEAYRMERAQKIQSAPIHTTQAAPYTTKTYSATRATPYSVDRQVKLYQEPAKVTPSAVIRSIPAATPAPDYDYNRNAVTPMIKSSMHNVVRGDTLYNIAKRNNVSVADLKAENALTSNGIALGQKLKIPSATDRNILPIDMVPVERAVNRKNTAKPVKRLVRNVEPLPGGSTYRVLPKDTLYSISRQACVSMGSMKRLNNIANPNGLAPGQRLKLPDGHCLK
ncbi:MAG: LysM peptidoglycan-binding domain-containing protein [Maricaulaceae bacterium]